MKLSTMVKADTRVMLMRKAKSVQASMQRRLEWYLKNFPDRVKPLHYERVKATEKNLNSDYDLIDMNLNPQTQTLRKPVAELLEWVFEGLPPPTKAQHTPLQQALVDIMNDKGRHSRGAAHRFAISAETAYRTKLGWFMIFNTLTVAPGNYYKVFNKQSKEFKDYVRTIQRRIDQAENRAPAFAGRGDGQINHNYVAVVEEGGKLGRLHIHVLHFCRTLPRGSADPNYGKDVPRYREISGLKQCWRHGTSTPIAIRLNDQDAYARIGWRWPFDTKANKPLRFRSAQAVAGYMGKYITKGYNSGKRAKLLWRVRKNHNLGEPILEHLLQSLSPQQLLCLSSLPSLKLKLNNRTIPSSKLQLSALRRYRYLLQSSTQHSDSPSLIDLAKRVMPQPSLLQQSLASTQATLDLNLQNLSSIEIGESSLADICEDTRAAAQAAALLTDREFYPRSMNAYGTTGTKDQPGATGYSRD